MGAGVEIKNQEKGTAQYKGEQFFAASLKVFHDMRHKKKDEAVIIYLQCRNHQDSTYKFHNNNIPLMFYLVIVMHVHQNHKKHKKAEGDRQHFPRNRRQCVNLFQKQDCSPGVSDFNNRYRRNHGNIQHRYEIKALHKA